MLLKIRVAKILQGFVTSQLTEYTPPPIVVVNGRPT